MDKFDELLKKLKSFKEIQKKGDWAENLPQDIWEEHFNKNFSQVASGLDTQTHRWYETSTTVIKIYERFLGIAYITNMFSEMQDYEDCYVEINYSEMEEVQITSYKYKKEK